MFTKRVGFCCSCLLILLCICTSAAMGQSTGTVSGTVTDSSGGVVAGCTVYLKDAATGSARTTSTNDNGFFVLAYVSPGTYTVTVTKQGFKTTAVSNQVVEVGKQLTVNAVLEVGSISNTVEVTFSPGAELQTMDATVGATLSGETLINLPNTTRDASTLAVLQPGQNINGNVGGAASDQNTFTLDGGYATDDMSGDNNTYIRSFSGDTGGGTGAYHSSGFNQAPSAVVPIPVTSVEVFKVSTANQTADFTGGAGSEVQVVTKRGTNATEPNQVLISIDLELLRAGKSLIPTSSVGAGICLATMRASAFRRAQLSRGTSRRLHFAQGFLNSMARS